LSLSLNKYYVITPNLLLNESPRHKDVWGSYGIAPCILNLGTRWM